MRVTTGLTITLIALLLLVNCTDAPDSGQGPPQSFFPTNTEEFSCSADGAPPIRTVQPATIQPSCDGGRVLSFDQNGLTRYACLNLPQQAHQEQSRTAGYKWPLLIYLHGSLTTPGSLYTLGRDLFDLHDVYPLSNNPEVRGFVLLAPEGRRATPWPAGGPQTGTGFHWDEWYRNPSHNLDALAIDHFVDEVLAMGLVDPSRIYVFGWSNGAYMAALYGVWRSDRIAAIAQYAGADPWSRPPCPVPLQYQRQVPLVLLRNLCDDLVPCATTNDWIVTLTEQGWPFEYNNLNLRGDSTVVSTACDSHCSKIIGLYEHIRWPMKEVLREKMLRFLGQHNLQ